MQIFSVIFKFLRELKTMYFLFILFLTYNLETIYCGSPVSFIFRRQFGFDADSILLKCDSNKANDVLNEKKKLLKLQENISSTIEKKITNDSLQEDLNFLINHFCDVNQNISFLSQKLIDNVEICLKKKFDDIKKEEIVREFVTNICAAIYNKYNLMLVQNIKN
ncbi:uncharacterized protein LOC127289115 isoform X2 [Leptopilina boulardi]|uniref:uncharacterized protein LOC127289115 isoform X2 n=1 Tax=Leptopilina boulardi TaxID=63433 RepID=UPI0021F5C1D5|nr:uncharacterized protein LOC127289115 isoform X2 [Leptopilina boulardi]